MDPLPIQIIKLVAGVLPYVAIIVALGVGGSLLSTWLKIKNGYPLSNSWGMPLHPKKDAETVERVRLLTTENAQLRAELGSIKDRLETLDRLRQVLTRDGRTLAQAALGWLWARSAHTIPIPGFKTVKQVEEDVGAAQVGPLTAEQMQEIDRLLVHS